MLQKQKDPEEAEMENRKKKEEKGKQVSQKRNPLRDFNSLSTEAPNGCLKFFLPSNYSSSSSSSKTLLAKKPKSFAKFTRKAAPTPRTAPNLTKPRSKRIHFKENGALPKPNKDQSFLHQWKNDGRPSSKNGLRLDISSDLASGCEESGEKSKALEPKAFSGEPIKLLKIENNLKMSSENITPVNKLLRGSNLNSAIFGEYNVNSNSCSKAKTPPVEPSVSPEIQFGASASLVSGQTPVCYGAGHVLSGVTDKRKCRPRGILTVGGAVECSIGSEKDQIGGKDDDSNDCMVNVKVKESRPSLIPLPAEASMRWLLSPCDEDSEGQKGDLSSRFWNVADDVGSSPSMCIVSGSDLLCDRGECSGSSFQDTHMDSGKTRIVLLSPRRITELEEFSENSTERFDRDSPLICPPVTSHSIDEQDNKISTNSPVKENSPLSIGSLSSGNVIQTPDSDSGLGKNIRGSWLKGIKHQKQTFKSELDLVAQVRHRSSLSPRSQISMWDPPGLSSQFTDLSSPSHSADLPQLQKNLDTLSSWRSDSSLENVSHSEMRISWREGLASRIFDIDELDCCRCLSDDDIGADEQHKSSNECRDNKENDLPADSCLKSPEYIGQEADVFMKRKEKYSPYRPGTCAESISTDGGGLAASGDSDWASCYENQLFKV